MNKYSKYKIVWFPWKLESIRDKKITPPIYIRYKPINSCNNNCSFCSYRKEISGMHGDMRYADCMPEKKMIEFMGDCKRMEVKAMTLSVRGNENILINNCGKIELAPIKEVVKRKLRRFSIGESNGFVKTGKIIKWYRHKANCGLLKIKTACGYSLTMTPNHSAYVYRENRLININTSELKIGDLIATPREIKTEENETIYSNDFFRLMGYFVSEGSYGDCAINFDLGFNKFEQILIKDITNIAKKMGYNCSIYKKQTNKTQVVIFSKKLMDEFKLYLNDKCRNKNIPSIVLNASREKKLEFMYGLYAGDGCVRYNKKSGRCILNLKTSSKLLSDGLITLWRTFGEFVNVYEGINKIRYIDDRKLEESNYFSIDFNGFRILKYKFIAKLFKQKGIKPRQLDTKYSFIQRDNRNIIKYYNDLALLKVTKIEELDNDFDERVYDISVDGTHNFFAGNGLILTHNTGGGEPLIYPHIVLLLKLMRKYNIDMSIITNGLSLDGERAELLKYAKWVRVSVDYYNANGYAKSRRIPKRNFYKVVKNIKEFDKIRTGDLELNYIVHKDNYKDVYKTVKFWKNVGVDNIRFCPAWFPNFFEYHKKIYPEFKKQYAKAKKLETDRFTIGESFTKEYDGGCSIERKYTKCPMMQILPVVGADCNVYTCHNKAYDKTGIIGSIKKQSFMDMWYSKKTSRFFNKFNPCEHCKHQCTNDAKNIIINEILESGDNFV